MPEERGLYPRMKILDQLVYFARLHGFSRTDAQRPGHRAVGVLRPRRPQRRPARQALPGQPAAGADRGGAGAPARPPWCSTSPSAAWTRWRSTRWSSCSTPRRADVPVLFSSHQLDLVERLCDDVVVLSGGRVVAAGSVEELRAGADDQYRVEVDGDAAWLRDVARHLRRGRRRRHRDADPRRARRARARRRRSPPAPSW